MKKSLFSLEIINNKEAHNLSVALGMVGLNVGIATCDLILQTQKEMSNNFTISKAVDLKIAHEKKYEQIMNEYENQ